MNPLQRNVEEILSFMHFVFFFQTLQSSVFSFVHPCEKPGLNSIYKNSKRAATKLRYFKLQRRPAIESEARWKHYWLWMARKRKCGTE